MKLPSTDEWRTCHETYLRPEVFDALQR
jgi:hypothetical protein